MTDFYVVEAGARYPQSYADDLATAERRVAELKTERPADWRIVPCDRWLIEREASYLEQAAVEITASDFDEMLNILPPIDVRSGDCDRRFNMSEFTEGRITTQFAQVGGRYFRKPVRHGDVSTYITAAVAR